MMPMQLGPIMRMPARPDLVEDLLLERPAGGAGFAESGADDDERLDAFGDAVVHDRAHLRARHADDGEVDVAGNRRRRVGYAGDAVDGRRRWDGRRTAGRVKPPSTRLCRISEPIFPRSRLAPIDRHGRGSKKLFIDAVAAACDRSAALASYGVVGVERQRRRETRRPRAGVRSRTPSRETPASCCRLSWST